MVCDLDSVLEGWDRPFLNLSSTLSEPFCMAWNLFCYRLVAPLDPQKFENCTTKAKEIATRTLILVGTIFSGFLTYAMPMDVLGSIAVLGMGSRIFRAIGFAMQKGGYTYVRGRAPEKSLNPQDPQIKIMSWNICGIGGGMSLDHGGVVHWRYRLNQIVEKIQTEDPDVLIVQEVYDTALAEALIQKLQSDYAHFFVHLGPNTWGCVGGCMILSKCAVHHFSHTSFDNNDWTLNRGFESLEIKTTPRDTVPFIRIIGTHLIHGDQPQDKQHRMQQVLQIVNHVAHQRSALTTVLAGDLNMERDGKEGLFLSSYLEHSYQGFEPTCTNRLTAQWDDKIRSVWEETIDYISLLKNEMTTEDAQGAILENAHLVKAFDTTYNTKTALSDHHGLSVLIRLHFSNKFSVFTRALPLGQWYYKLQRQGPGL